MAKGNLQIDLLGTSFAIQADEKDEYLSALYNHYKKTVTQIEQTSDLNDPLRIAIIAGILITDELYKEKLKHPDQKGAIDLEQVERMAMEMISRIDQAIK